MSITSVELWQVRSPLSTPYHLSKVYGTLTHAEAVMVRITDGEGNVGWGEADPMRPFTDESSTGVFGFLTEIVPSRLIGRDPQDHAVLLGELDALAAGQPLARGAIDMALHDLVARRSGLRVCDLLGGRLRSSIPLLWPLGSEPLMASMAVVEAKVAQGYRSFMIKAGSRDVGEDAKRTRALIERFHPDVSFIADANQGWSESEALRFVSMIGTAPLALLEQPVARTNDEGMKRVREAALVPVSADEAVFSLGQAARLASDRAVDAFSIKVSKNGGLVPARKIAALAEGHGIAILMNSMIEFGVTQAASLQLGVTLPNLLDVGHAYMSVLRLEGDPTDFATCVDAAVATLPDAPGLGVRVDAGQLGRIAVAHARITADGTSGVAA